MHLAHDLGCLVLPRRPHLETDISGLVSQRSLVEVVTNLLDSRRVVSPRKRQPPWNAGRYRSKTKWPLSIPRQIVADSAPKVSVVVVVVVAVVVIAKELLEEE